MPTDLDDLLPGAAGDPTEPLDVDELWARGRSRRRWRRASTVAGSLASIAVLAVAVTTIDLGGTATPEVAPLGAGESTDASDDTTDDTTGDAAEASGDDSAPAVDDDEVESDETAADPSGQELGEQEDPAAEAESEPTDQEPAPSPDPAALEDPCAGSADRQGEAFIEVVGPVDGQVVGDSIELVGCASVYEGTVRYRLLSGDQVLVDSFTTATYGGPELGEFSETIPVESSGTLTLQVFWDSPADGEGERDLAQITVEAS